MRFIVISEVYGGPVSATTVEELHYYGIRTILGIGFVGSFNKTISLGHNIIGEKALSEQGTTLHYSNDKFTHPTTYLYNYLNEVYTPSTIWTTNALYREFQSDIDRVVAEGCGIVNMDTSHLFACCKHLNLNCVYLATVSDNMIDGWDNQLTGILDKQSNIVQLKQTELVISILNQLDFINIITKIHKLIIDHNICRSHDVDHVIRVMKHIEKALSTENIDDKTKRLIMYAGLLHDVDDNKFFPQNKNYENLREILSGKSQYSANQKFLGLGLSQEDIQLVIEMVSYVSSSVNGDSIPSRCVENPWLLYPRYADRLEAIGNIGIIRCWQYTKTLGNKLFTDKTPRAKNIDDLWVNIATIERYQSYNGKSVSMIDHYYDKLLRLANFTTNNTYFIEERDSKLAPMIDLIMEFSAKGSIDDNYFTDI